MAGARHSPGCGRFGLALAVALSALAFAANAQADQFTFDFSSTQYFDRASTTGLWDTQFASGGRIWAKVAAAGDVTKTVDFGDASDGAFVDGPTQSGISVSGSTITIDTDVKSNFQFSSFTLSAGKTLVLTGSNSLVLRVYGTTNVAGTILADGEAGAGNGIAGLGNQTIGRIAGGTAIAGGGNGGDGGQTDNTPPTNGAPAPRGGALGSNSTVSMNDFGGGGGCNGAGATDGEAGVGFGAGAAGTCGSQSTVADAFESGFSGGGGGGGGGNVDCGGGCGATQVVGGAAGGAGGGAIRIVSLGTISFSGTISAKGGAGGINDAENLAGDCGGGGGGGSGGSLWMQTLYSITGSGTVDVTKGIGGVSVTCAGISQDAGGDGSNGILRIDHNSIGTPGSPDLDQSVTAPSAPQTYLVVSKAIPFTLGYYEFQPPTEISDCGSDGTLSVVYEGSNDGVTFQSAVPAAQISTLNAYAYLRFKATIASTGVNPPCLTGLTINYTAKTLTDLSLKGGLACGTVRNGPGAGKGLEGGSRGSGSPGNAKAIAMDAIMLAFAFAFGRRRSRRNIKTAFSPMTTAQRFQFE